MATKQISHWLRKGLSLYTGIGMMVAIIGGLGVKASGETSDLRGYGRVEASITPHRSEFICEDEKKADILLGKLLADMFWDAGGSHIEKTIDMKIGWLFVDTMTVPVHLYPPYGALIAGRSKNRVMVFGGKDEQESLSRMKEDGGLSSGKAVFKPSGPYPMYLDFYDLRAWKSATPGLYPGNKYQNDDRMQFAKKFCNGGLMGGIFFRDASAEGVHAGLSNTDTDADICEKENQMYSISIGTGVWPGWARNRWPQLIDRDSDGSPAGHIYGSYHGPVESFGIQPEQRRRTSLNFLKNLMLRYKNRDMFGGWELYCGDYIFESFFSNMRQAHLGYSAVGQDGFRRWLKEIRGLSLQGLGERWHGNPSHFKDWSEVRLPDDINGFFGNLDDQCLRIQNNWCCLKAAANPTEMPAESAPGWVPVDDATSRMMSLMLGGQPSFWRTNFNADTWLKQNAGKDAYLVFNVINGGWGETPVWLNGKSLGKFKSKVNPYMGPFALKVTGLITNGVNRLGLYGHINGPVFLTTSKPQGYPYLGKQQNARYVDMLEWQLYAFNALETGAMEYGRSIEPDRPFVISAAGEEVKDGQGDALARFGGSMQDTGYESSYRPFNSRLGYAGGFYGSCEPAGYIPTKAPGNMPETRMLGWVLLNGEGHFRMTGDASYFYEIEKKSGWCAKNQRNIQLVGKYLPEKPDIAILSSSRSALLGYQFHSMGDWNIGRGELHAAHYDNVYVTETMLAKGMADDYPVLFDTDTMYMGEDTIDSIRKYVEKGGTFVALHNSGRHSLLEADSWPISELTGFKVLGLGKKGNLKFEKELPIFKGWEGKEFEGEGSSLDWKDTQSAKDVSVGLEPLSKGTVALARWEDGTVAVGMRTLGRGKVVVLGSTFWRYGRDLGGTGIWKIQDVGKEFFERLFTDLGVKRTATASDKGVFARKIITKNGLQEGMIVMDAAGSGMKADAGFATAEKPSEVRDMVAQKPVAFEYEDGWVKIKDVDIAPWGTRIFGIRRADMAGGVDFWWKEKTKFWNSAKVKPFVETAEEDNANPSAISFEAWKFHADKDGAAGKTDDWLNNAFDDGNWRNINNEPWNIKFEDLKDYGGAGLYRSLPFALPSGWKNRRITLNMAGGGCFSKAEFYLNGEPIAGIPRPHRKCDVTDKLKKDGNVLSLKLTGTKPLSGLLGCAVWIQPEIKLSPCISLLGEWEAVMGDWTSREKAGVPGVDRALTDSGYLWDDSRKKVEDEGYVMEKRLAARGHHLVRDVDVPAGWQGKNIYLHLDSPMMHGQKLPLAGLGNGMLVINGQPMSFTAPPNTPIDDEVLNLTPHVKFGKKNRIELWPARSMSLFQERTEDALIIINNIEIGCEAE
ncbi:MAG: hypothetical protein WAX69_13965 [Victivallales bacterium]